MFINNIFHNKVDFWNSRLVLTGISAFWERVAFSYFCILSFYLRNQNPFLQLVYFIKFRLRLWINSSGPRPFWTLLLVCWGFSRVWREGIFCDSTYPFGCVIWCWSDWELSSHHWPLHLVNDFHISKVPSILFHRSPSQKDICFLQWYVAL